MAFNAMVLFVSAFAIRTLIVAFLAVTINMPKMVSIPFGMMVWFMLHFTQSFFVSHFLFAHLATNQQETDDEKTNWAILLVCVVQFWTLSVFYREADNASRDNAHRGGRGNTPVALIIFALVVIHSLAFCTFYITTMIDILLSVDEKLRGS
jgi:heme/copper-type cytochrome/quinol oxidase subunit 2